MYYTHYDKLSLKIAQYRIIEYITCIIDFKTLNANTQ